MVERLDRGAGDRHVFFPGIGGYRSRAHSQDPERVSV
jgi:hypothetical protein